MSGRLRRRFVPRSVPVAAALCAALLTPAVLAPALPGAAAAAPPAAVAAPSTTTTDPAAAAAGWLAQQFSTAAGARGPGGNHIELSYTDAGKTVRYFDGGTTIDAVLALAATHTGASTVAAAMGYLARHLGAYVDYAGAQGGPYYGSIGKAALAALVTGADPQSFGGHHLLTELKRNECPSGSTRCTPGSNSNVGSGVATSFIVLAEARGAARDGARFAPSPALVSLLLSMQCRDGGFLSDQTRPHCVSDVDATGYAVMALQALGGHRDRLDRAAAYLAATRAVDGSWSAQGGADVDTTALATAALAIAGRDVAASRRWLAAQQVRTGPTVGPGARRGALKYQGRFAADASIKATADAILALVPGTSLATLTAAHSRAGTSVLALPAPTLSRSSVPVGATVTVSDTGFATHEPVHAVVAGRTLATARADSSGGVRLGVTVPAGSPAGAQVLELAGARSGLTARSTLRVRAVAASPVAATGRAGGGGTLRDALMAGLAAVVLAAAAALLTRRGRRSR